jgi:restriction system protein
VVERTGLTEEQVTGILHSNGNPVAFARISWAASYLKIANALVYPRRAVFALGPNAEKLLALGRPATVGDLREFPEWKEHLEKKQAQAKEPLVTTDSSPEDLIEQGYKQLKDALIDELLEHIKGIRPHDFETLVLRLLAALGYGGGDWRAIQGVPRGPDGGIDGRIDEDVLGLDQIYIQAKRYSDNSVGRPTVQGFVGAMTGGGCKKGVFVTSSTFTRDAVAYASEMRDLKLVLIDGPKLADLMIEHKVGVQVKNTYKISKVDYDYFNLDD